MKNFIQSLNEGLTKATCYPNRSWKDTGKILESILECCRTTYSSVRLESESPRNVLDKISTRWLFDKSLKYKEISQMKWE